MIERCGNAIDSPTMKRQRINICIAKSDRSKRLSEGARPTGAKDEQAYKREEDKDYQNGGKWQSLNPRTHKVTQPQWNS